MNNDRISCSHCGAKISSEAAVLCEGDYLCPECADELTVRCDRCDQRTYLSHATCDEHLTLCPTCFDRYYHACSECGRILYPSDTFFDDDDEAFCYSCYQKHHSSDFIHDYSYKPEPLFYGDGSRYFGVELEIDEAGTSKAYAQQILSVANRNAEHLYIKKDGSLDDGMELVTHPMTLGYHMQDMPWGDVLKKVIELGYLSHQTSTCGLHIHISREAFGLTYTEQELGIARLLYFVEKFWPELLRFSRRTERQMNRWAARYGMQLSPKEVMSYAKNSCAGRYAAVNLTNSETVEIRIFRGTLKLNTLLAALQLVNAICDVAVFMSDDEIQALSWHGFLDQIKEPELIRYLKERMLYKNEPIDCEVDA